MLIHGEYAYFLHLRLIRKHYTVVLLVQISGDRIVKYSIFCGPLQKEPRERLVKCFVWSVALYVAET